MELIVSHLLKKTYHINHGDTIKIAMYSVVVAWDLEILTRAPPLPFLLSSLLQSRAQLKILNEQTGEDIDSYEDLD